MQATPEQRVEGRRKALLAGGLHPDEALSRAYEIEGVTPPEQPDVVDTKQELEDLHFRQSCETRRADAATERARKLGRENRILRSVIEQLDVAGTATLLILRAREVDSLDESKRLARARRRSDRVTT